MSSHPSSPARRSPRLSAVILILVVISAAYAVASRWAAGRIGPAFRITIVNPPNTSSNPVLEVTCCRQMEEIVFVHVTGKVKNIGSDPLKNVVAHARFFDRNGAEVASAQAMIYSPEIRPQDDYVGFQVTTPVNLSIATASVDFRQPSGPPLPARYREFDFSDH